jgi:hypothetical protein
MILFDARPWAWTKWDGLVGFEEKHEACYLSKTLKMIYIFNNPLSSLFLLLHISHGRL